MLNIVLFGPPGAGKGTQAAKIVETFNLTHLSTGDILRGEIAAKTKLGLEAKKLMDQGNLVSDSIVIGMIENKIQQQTHTAGFIFDGFPRTTAQAEALDDVLSRSGEEVSGMITLEVDNEELIRRLLKRGEQTGRSDDNLNTIQRRIQVYQDQTAPVIEYYNKRGKYKPVEGKGDIDAIFSRIADVIKGLDNTQ
ncbi:MAG: adenylate kinase [Bacteroidetes bacterium]|jgi:adenylate kinase|nr:adenylate kinase [Bacteroidota bacterium]